MENCNMVVSEDFEEFEEELEEISSHFRIVYMGFYAYVYWKSTPFEQVVPSLMKRRAYTERGREDSKLFIPGRIDTIYALKKRLHHLKHNPINKKELSSLKD